jgi:hypothetical protein
MESSWAFKSINFESKQVSPMYAALIEGSAVFLCQIVVKILTVQTWENYYGAVLESFLSTWLVILGRSIFQSCFGEIPNWNLQLISQLSFTNFLQQLLIQLEGTSIQSWPLSVNSDAWAPLCGNIFWFIGSERPWEPSLPMSFGHHSTYKPFSQNPKLTEHWKCYVSITLHNSQHDIFLPNFFLMKLNCSAPAFIMQ